MTIFRLRKFPHQSHIPSTDIGGKSEMNMETSKSAYLHWALVLFQIIGIMAIIFCHYVSIVGGGDVGVMVGGAGVVYLMSLDWPEGLIPYSAE